MQKLFMSAVIYNLTAPPGGQRQLLQYGGNDNPTVIPLTRQLVDVTQSNEAINLHEDS